MLSNIKEKIIPVWWKNIQYLLSSFAFRYCPSRDEMLNNSICNIYLRSYCNPIYTKQTTCETLLDTFDTNIKQLWPITDHSAYYRGVYSIAILKCPQKTTKIAVKSQLRCWKFSVTWWHIHLCNQFCIRDLEYFLT